MGLVNYLPSAKDGIQCGVVHVNLLIIKLSEKNLAYVGMEECMCKSKCEANMLKFHDLNHVS